MVSGLRWIGGITIALGVVIGIVLLRKFGQAGMFSEAELNPNEIGIAVGVAFYHFIFGMLCFGVAQVLRGK